MVARWTQALMWEGSSTASDRWAPGRLQVYVDDPSLVAWGPSDRRAVTFSLVTLWWLVLGIPLSWSKGALHRGIDAYLWIGVLFSTPAPGVARMSLPRKFVDALITLCRAFLENRKLPMASADALVGKAGRVVYVLPHTRPFVTTLYAALAASCRARAAGAREAGPQAVACRRFRFGARMLCRIFGFTDRRAPIPQCRDVFAVTPEPPNPTRRRIEVDASPWGGEGPCYS